MVLDFGLAKTALNDADTFRRVTDEGAFLGTLAYASPEQLRRDPAQIDVRSDVYSLGVILFEMLTGQLPIAIEGDLASIEHSVEHQTPARKDVDLRGLRRHRPAGGVVLRKG